MQLALSLIVLLWYITLLYTFISALRNREIMDEVQDECQRKTCELVDIRKLNIQLNLRNVDLSYTNVTITSEYAALKKEVQQLKYNLTIAAQMSKTFQKYIEQINIAFESSNTQLTWLKSILSKKSSPPYCAVNVLVQTQPQSPDLPQLVFTSPTALSYSYKQPEHAIKSVHLCFGQSIKEYGHLRPQQIIEMILKHIYYSLQKEVRTKHFGIIQDQLKKHYQCVST